MARPRVIFLCYHGKGHLNPCFPLAEILAVDYDVVFAGVAFFESYVRASGFSYYPLQTVPFGLGLEAWVNTVQQRTPHYLHTLRDRWNDRLYMERARELTTMLDQLQPTLILVDDRQSSDFLVLYPHLHGRGIKFGIVHAMPPAALIPGVPPINTTAFPGDSAGIRRAHIKVKLQRLKRLWKQKLLYLGMDDSSILRRRIRRNNIPRHFFSGRTIYYGLALQNIHELILLPEELNFPGIPTSPMRHYIGALHRAAMAPAEASERYIQIRRHLQQEIAAGKVCIYCSIGTVQPEQAGHTEEFIKRLIASIHDKPVVLLLSLASLATTFAADYAANEHVYIFDTVPQLDVLSYAGLFITHGGINSIKESIDAGVPMLVYPVDSILDPPGNAVRVAYHGLGLRGNMVDDTVADIAHNIQTVLTDAPYRQKIQALQDACRAYTPERFLQAIRQCTVPV
jgi:UDP:flavonoid glycosyltransferase YjiC (YdhE family)